MADLAIALAQRAVGRSEGVVEDRIVAREQVRGAERPGVAAVVAQPGRRADAPVLAAIGRERDDGGELALVGQRLVGAEALALAAGPPAFGAPGAVQHDDGAGGSRDGQGGESGEAGGEQMAAGDGHVSNAG